MEMFEGIFQYRIIELNVCSLMLSSLITGNSTGRKTNGVKIVCYYIVRYLGQTPGTRGV